MKNGTYYAKYPVEIIFNQKITVMNNNLQKWTKRGLMSMVMLVVFAVMTGSINAQFSHEEILAWKREHPARLCLQERIAQHIRHQSYDTCCLEPWMLSNPDWGSKSIREEREMEELLPWMCDASQWLCPHSTANNIPEPEPGLEKWMFDVPHLKKVVHWKAGYSNFH